MEDMEKELYPTQVNWMQLEKTVHSRIHPVLAPDPETCPSSQTVLQ
jgi:hypothetical protein